MVVVVVMVVVMVMMMVMAAVRDDTARPTGRCRAQNGACFGSGGCKFVTYRMYVVYLRQRLECISLGDVDNCTNSVGFRGSLPLLPHLCPLSVPEVGVCGAYIARSRPPLPWR